MGSQILHSTAIGKTYLLRRRRHVSFSALVRPQPTLYDIDRDQTWKAQALEDVCRRPYPNNSLIDSVLLQEANSGQGSSK